MIRKLLLTILLFSLQGCTWQNLFFNDTPFDIMTVVNYTGEVRHSRGYYKRDDLVKFKNHLYYKTFYHSKKSILYILLHKDNGYYLYNISASNKKENYLGNSHTSYNTLIRKLRKRGIVRLIHPSTKGYQLTYAFRKYLDTKTILFTLSDYSSLLSRYSKAIRHYDYNSIQKEHHHLPKKMIQQLYDKYKRIANTKQKKDSISKIGYKLGFEKQDIEPTHTIACKNTHLPDIKPEIKHKSAIKETTLEDKDLEVCSNTQENSILIKNTSYEYYLYNAPLDTLENYVEKLSLQEYDKEISQAQLHQLLLRRSYLQEKELLKHGTLEELIQAYKKNKQRRYKEKILLLMKEKK